MTLLGNNDRDDAERIVAALTAAAEQQRKISICGSGSKAQRYPCLAADNAHADSERLSTLDHCGIVHYAPDELVLEARSGTPLATIEQALAQHEQMLAFEPPRYRAGGTLGGAVACGLSGPARPWRGALRDAVLGVEMVNGLGERLRFGGRVVKNVAGYDASRLQAGAFGTFGCLLSVCVRVMPRPLSELTLQFERTAAQALAAMATWPRQSLPFAGSYSYQERLYVRLLGAPDAVAVAAKTLGGERCHQASLWDTLRDQAHPFFESTPSLWRASLPMAAAELPGDERALIEWGGAQRWYQEADRPTEDAVAKLGGYMQHYTDTGLASKDPAIAMVQTQLRQAFDPNGLVNSHLSTHAY